MEKKAAEQELWTLREQISYHSRKYYTEDDPKISDFEYDRLYRRLEELEGLFPELITEGLSIIPLPRWFIRCRWTACMIPSRRRNCGILTAVSVRRSVGRRMW